MPLHYHSPIYFLHYFLKREASQFFVSIAIRNLALGMVLIFEPIYIYLHFGSSLPLTLLYFGIIHGLFGLMAFFFGGKIMAKVGLKHCMLLSHPFFLGNYICLFFLPNFSWLIFFAIISRFLGMFFSGRHFILILSIFPKRSIGEEGWGVLISLLLRHLLSVPLLAVGYWLLRDIRLYLFRFCACFWHQHSLYFCLAILIRFLPILIKKPGREFLKKKIKK